MEMEGNQTLGGDIQQSVLQISIYNCTLENYGILLINITPIHVFIFLFKFNLFVYNIIFISGVQSSDSTFIYIHYNVITSLSPIIICHHTNITVLLPHKFKFLKKRRTCQSLPAGDTWVLSMAQSQQQHILVATQKYLGESPLPPQKPTLCLSVPFYKASVTLPDAYRRETGNINN